MIVYHGSDSNFKKLKIAPRLCKRISTSTNEGYGIYFTTDKELARSYGKYIYTLDIADSYFYDFRIKSNCVDYLTEIIVYIRTTVNIDIRPYIYKELVTNMYCGGQYLFKLGHELINELESNTDWYKNTTQALRNKVYVELRRCDRILLPKAYMFNYHIKDIGVIKNTDEQYVKIISKEHSY